MDNIWVIFKKFEIVNVVVMLHLKTRMPCPHLDGDFLRPRAKTFVPTIPSQKASARLSKAEIDSQYPTTPTVTTALD